MKLNKNFGNGVNTLEAYAARVACGCEGKCNCACVSEPAKKSSKTGTTLTKDPYYSANVYAIA